MILYNASTSAGLRNHARFLTNTNTTTFTDADLDSAINTYYHQFVNNIVQSMDDWDFQGETATADLVASQQEYLFPTDILKIKRIEITYDGTNWNKVKMMDINKRSGATDSTTIGNEFNTEAPFADLHDQSLFLYPIPTAASTAGLKIWYEKEATELSAATSEPKFLEAYHKGLSYGAAIDYFEKYSEVEGNTNKRNLAKQNYNKIVEDMEEFYQTRNQDREYVIQPSFVDYDYGTNK